MRCERWGVHQAFRTSEQMLLGCQKLGEMGILPAPGVRAIWDANSAVRGMGHGTLWIYVVSVQSNGSCSHRATWCNTYKDFVVASSTDSRHKCTEQWWLESTFRWGGGQA